MRLLVATDQWFPDLRGGVARVASDTSRLLAEAGHDVVVLAPRHADLPTVSVDGRLTVRRVLPRSRLPQTFTDVIAAAQRARREPGSFDLLVAHQTTTAAGLRAARPGVPLALVFHASAPREVRLVRAQLPRGPGRLATYPLAGWLTLLERQALRSSARVLVLSDYSRSLLPPSAARRGVVVGGAVDVHRFAPAGGPGPARARLGLPPTEPLVVTARRLEPRMGLENLLAAVALLGSPVQLAIVGGGSLEGRLRDLAGSLGLARRVRFVGRVPDAQLLDWYRAADLFALPTLAYEGFGLVTAEALACGTPVVGTRAGATPELLRPLEPRLLAGSTDPAAIARALERGLALSSPELRQRCRAHAESHLAWEHVFPVWERTLAAAAARPARGVARPQAVRQP